MANVRPNALQRLAARVFKRSFMSSEDAANGGWLSQQMRALIGAKGGKLVTPEVALCVSAAFACARVVAEDSAMARLVVKTRPAGSSNGWKIEDDHWIVRLFRKPNDWQTEIEFRTMLGLHAVLDKGGFAFINRIGGKVVELLPYPAGSVRPVQEKDWSLWYDVRLPGGSTQRIPAANMFHLRGPSWDGVVSFEVYKAAREAIGISIAAEESHAALHRNGVKLSGVLTTGQGAPVLSDEAAKRVAKEWRENFGPESEHPFGIAVLEGGMKFEPMAMTSAAAQHLETRRFQIEEICRFFRVHPSMIGHLDKQSSLGSSAEQVTINHISHTIMPWCLRWEQRVDRDFLAPSSERNIWITFDPSGLARGDMAARASFYNSGIHAGWMNRNEPREREGMERGPDELDEFLAPTQLAPGASADATNGKSSGSQQAALADE